MFIAGGARLLLMVPHELQCGFFLGGEYTDTLLSSHQKDVDSLTVAPCRRWLCQDHCVGCIQC